MGKIDRYHRISASAQSLNFNVGSFARKLSLGILGLEAFVLGLSIASHRLRSCVLKLDGTAGRSCWNRPLGGSPGESGIPLLGSGFIKKTTKESQKKSELGEGAIEKACALCVWRAHESGRLLTHQQDTNLEPD